MNDDHDRAVMPPHSMAPVGTDRLDAREPTDAVAGLPGVPAPPGAPNVVVVLIDDMGFGGPSTFGGPCQTPTADRLARRGVRFNRFHVNAMCSPTRQSLMTGRNHHAVGMGATTEYATMEPGYNAVRPDTACTLAQVLRANGYSTGAFGKMHQTPQWEASPAGPFDRWPTSEGFERFYGFLGPEMNHWDPLLYDGTTPVEPNEPRRDGYHLSEDLADHAIDWVRLHDSMYPDKPFFCYFALGACHAPLHVPSSWREPYRGAFDHGWIEQRHRTLAKQIAMGVVPSDTRLAPWCSELPQWDDLTADEKHVAAAFMETYAAVAEHADAHVGRLIDAIEQLERLENTLVIYIMGDNGASGEGGRLGSLNAERRYSGIDDPIQHFLEHLDELGGPTTYPIHPAAWAHAMSTPHQWSKMVASHFGGTRDGMLMHWPDGIGDRGTIQTQWHHVVDIFPTILEAAGVREPTTFNGVTQDRRDGISMMYALDNDKAPDRRQSQYFEMLGNRAIYHDGWIAAIKHRSPWDSAAVQLPAYDSEEWQLYDLSSDWSQGVDIAARHPDRVRELEQRFMVEAARNRVFPLDDRATERMNAGMAGRPDPFNGREEMLLHDGTRRLVEDTVLNVKNRSHEVLARVRGGSADSGVIIAQGGSFAGWALHLIDGYPIYTYNYFGVSQTELISNTGMDDLIAADESLSDGRRDYELHVVFNYLGSGYGGPAHIRLLLDNTEVGAVHIDRTVPYLFSCVETTNIGVDHGTPVSSRYRQASDTRCTASIESVRLRVMSPLLAGTGAAAARRGLASQ